MWLLFLFAGAAVLLLSGCDRIVYPGDGRLIIVEIDPDMDGCPFDSSITVGDAIRKGIRYWDDAGARLRTMDQLLPSETVEAKGAPKLRFHGDACSTMNRNASGDVGKYNYYTGDVELFLKNWKGLDALTIITDIAHEVGHAIGLDHVSDQRAVMYKDPNPQWGLADSDLQEYGRVWN